MLCQPDTPHRAKIAQTGGKHAYLLWPRSKPWPNKAVEPTPNSFRSCVAPAIGRGSPRAFGYLKNRGWSHFLVPCMLRVHGMPGSLS